MCALLWDGCYAQPNTRIQGLLGRLKSKRFGKWKAKTYSYIKACLKMWDYSRWLVPDVSSWLPLRTIKDSNPKLDASSRRLRIVRRTNALRCPAPCRPPSAPLGARLAPTELTGAQRSGWEPILWIRGLEVSRGVPFALFPFTFYKNQRLKTKGCRAKAKPAEGGELCARVAAGC